MKSLHIPADKGKRLIDIAIIAIIFIVVRNTVNYFDIKYASQVALVISLLTISVMLKKQGRSWRDLGFRRPAKWGIAVLLTLLCIASIGLIFNFVVAPLFPEGAHDINRGEAITFNEMLFQVTVIAIAAAGIGEEMLMRGFLLNWLNDITGKNFLGTFAAVLIQAVIFAILHRGMQGMVSAGVIGLILGFYYIISKRNLLVVMVAHAIPDLLSVISSYQNQ